MRGKNLNCGIRGGLWDEAHLERMGPAVWLFGWLVHRQTRERNGVGLVLGGSPVTYDMIQGDTGYARRTLQRWMADLRAGGYVRVRRTCHSRMIIEVLKAKKFPPKQMGFPQAGFFTSNSSAPLLARRSGPSAPNVAQMNGGGRQSSHTPAMGYAVPATSHRQYKPERQLDSRTPGGDFTPSLDTNARRNTVQPLSEETSNSTETPNSQRIAKGQENSGCGIAAPHSFVNGNGKNRIAPQPYATRAYAPSSPYRYGQNQRALREAAVRAELRVGAGPEMRRE